MVDFSSQFFKYYFSIEVDDKPGTAAKVTSQFAKLQIGIDELNQKESLKKGKARIVIVTDPAKEQIVNKLKNSLKRLSSTKDVRLIRIEL